jgi:enoyl-CoA hydratase
VTHDPSIGAVVVQGEGGTFCSGLDTGVIDVQRRDPASSVSMARADLVYGSFVRIGALPVPTIAAVRGAAVGAGLNLALATDLRVVARSAVLRAGFTRLGLHPGGGFFALASRALGREAAAALGVFGGEMRGDRAAALGAAWAAVDDELVEDVALSMAVDVAADPELARATVRSFRHVTGPPAVGWSAALEVERGAQMWTFRRLRDRESGGQGD